MSEEDIAGTPGGPSKEVFNAGTPSGLPADESDGAKRIVVPLASVGGCFRAQARWLLQPA
jgi:hypothetical protein